MCSKLIEWEPYVEVTGGKKHSLDEFGITW